jgi:hypothetical protein
MGDFSDNLFAGPGTRGKLIAGKYRVAADGGPPETGNIMKRWIALTLAACIAFVLCACERTEFEKKSERDADARRALNTRPK